MNKNVKQKRPPLVRQRIFQALIISLLTLVLVVVDLVFHGPLSAVDVPVATFFFHLRSGFFIHLFYFITLFAESWVVVALAALLGLFFLVKRQYQFFATLGVALVSSEGVTFFGKLIFQRVRPALALASASENSFSFPSGHATTVVVFYGFILYLLLQTHKTRLQRFWLSVSLVVGICLIDVSRLYLDVHYLTDVIAGNLIGLAGLLFALMLVPRLTRFFKTVGVPKLFTWKQAACLGAIACLIVIPLFLRTPLTP